MDFLLKKIPNTPEQLKAILEEIIATETGNDFISFEIKNVVPISVAKEYPGIAASLAAKIKNTKTPFCIDFGVGDVIVPRQEKRKIPTQLDDFDSPTVNTYSLETTVAEKLDAILSLMEFSSRMKDYYDLYYLARISFCHCSKLVVNYIVIHDFCCSASDDSFVQPTSFDYLF